MTRSWATRMGLAIGFEEHEVGFPNVLGERPPLAASGRWAMETGP